VPLNVAASYAAAVDDRTWARLRLSAAFLAVPFGAWLLWLSWGPLQRLFAEDRDNPSVVYLLFGAPFLVAGLALLGFAARTLWSRPHSDHLD
jgi:hypothetical protein